MSDFPLKVVRAPLARVFLRARWISRSFSCSYERRSLPGKCGGEETEVEQGVDLWSWAFPRAVTYCGWHSTKGDSMGGSYGCSVRMNKYRVRSGEPTT